MYSRLKRLPNSEEFKRVIHVSHDDLDGISPLILSQIAFANKEVITASCSYDKVDEVVMDALQNHLLKDSVMFITDISPSHEVLLRADELVRDGYFIFLLDHHDPKPNVPVEQYGDWMMLCQYYADGRGTAATSMYYDFLIHNEVLKQSPLMDDFVELVRLYDTWEWADCENSRAKRLNDFLFMTSKEEFTQQVLSRLKNDQDPQFRFDAHIEFMLDMEQKRIEEYCKLKKKQLQVFRGTVDDTDRIYTYGVVFAEAYQSELGNYLYKEYPEDIDFIVMIDPGRKKISLRCNKNKPIDVGSIARYFGGGGRSATAGCPLNARSKYQFMDRLLLITLS